MGKLPKTTKNFLKYHTLECTQSFHRISKEKRLAFWDVWWRDVMTDKSLRHKIGETIINKVLPAQAITEGNSIDQSQNYRIEVIKVDGSKDTASITREPVKGLGEQE